MFTDEQLDTFLYVQKCIKEYINLFLKVKFLKKAEFLRMNIENELLAVDYRVSTEVTKNFSIPTTQKIYFNLSDVCLNYGSYMVELRKEEADKGLDTE